ncbi:MAG: 2-dehydropantoate 2-reductase [Candidatus Binatia bacterium]|nr:2-dehydropantoate 2-reductase [Candidatus Binatia bacterium]
MADVLVLGAGAIGSVFGGLLTKAGHNVTLLGRPPHMEAVRKAGLWIRGIWGQHRCWPSRVVTSPTELRHKFDLVLVTVKSYDTATVAPLVPNCTADPGWVVSLQNGLGNLETLSAHVEPRRLLGGRVIFGARIVEPGTVEVTVCAEPVRVGPFLREEVSAKKAAEHWAAEFERAGIPAEPCASIEAELWAKVFYNAALNPLGALLGCTYGLLSENAETRAIMDRVIDEAFAVASAERVALRWGSAEEFRRELYAVLVPRTAAHRSSMLQDLELGKRTEIEAINGEVCRRGARYGVPTPFNELLTRLLLAADATARAGQTQRRWSSNGAPKARGLGTD